MLPWTLVISLGGALHRVVWWGIGSIRNVSAERASAENVHDGRWPRSHSSHLHRGRFLRGFLWVRAVDGQGFITYSAHPRIGQHTNYHFLADVELP